MKTTEKSFWIKLNGNSMSPLLHDQDNIFIAFVSYDQIKIGDIVLFKDHAIGELTLHRIIDFPFKTKGDFSLLHEENSIEFLLGKAMGFSRDKKYRSLDKFNNLFTLFSKLRNENYFVRKIGLIGLHFMTIIFEFYSAIAKIDRSKLPPGNDL
jgi:signal peptidase I